MADDEGYVHDPAAFGEREQSEDVEVEGRETLDGEAGDPHGERPRGADREFGWRGWVLVGFIVVAFVLVPGALYTLAYAREFVTGLGLGLRQAYLVLPLVPALVLGALAVWATTRP